MNTEVPAVAFISFFARLADREAVAANVPGTGTFASSIFSR